MEIIITFMLIGAAIGIIRGIIAGARSSKSEKTGAPKEPVDNGGW